MKLDGIHCVTEHCFYICLFKFPFNIKRAGVAAFILSGSNYNIDDCFGCTRDQYLSACLYIKHIFALSAPT